MSNRIFPASTEDLHHEISLSTYESYRLAFRLQLYTVQQRRRDLQALLKQLEYGPARPGIETNPATRR